MVKIVHNIQDVFIHLRRCGHAVSKQYFSNKGAFLLTPFEPRHCARTAISPP